MKQLLFTIIFISKAWAFCLNYTFTDIGGVWGSYLSPDGSTLAIPHLNGTVNFWDKYTKTLKSAYNGYGTWVDRVSYSKNGNYIAVVGHKKSVHILNSTTFALIVSINVSVGNNTYKVDFRYDDKMFILSGSSNIIQFWNVPSWTLNKTITAKYSLNYDIQYAQDDKFVVGGYNGLVAYDAAGTQTGWISGQILRLTIHPNNQTYVASLGNPYFIIGSWNGSYRVSTTPFSTIDCDFSLDGRYLVVSGSTGLINIYNATNYTLLQTLNTTMNASIFAIRISDDSRYLFSTTTNGQVDLYYRSDYYHFSNCSEICGDSITWIFPCDNQWEIPYDGCDNNCTIMTDFNCWVIDKITTCSYFGTLTANIINFNQTTFGVYNMTVSILPPLYAFSITTQNQFLTMFKISESNMHNISYNDQKNQFSFLFEPKIDGMLNQSINLTYQPTNNSNPMYSKGQTQTFSLQLTSQVCGDTYAFILPCDNQLGIPYDGCDDSCAVMSDFECWVNHTLTTCSYNGTLTHNLIDFHQQTLGKYNMAVSLYPPLYAFTLTDSQSFLDMFSIEGANVTNVSYDNVSGNFYFEFESMDDIFKPLNLTYEPTNNSDPMYSKGQTQTFSLQLTSQVCGDTYALILPCDNQLGIPYDGCNDTCTVMSDFECWVNHTLTTCSYNSTLTHNLIDFHQQTLGKYNMAVSLYPPLYAFTLTDSQSFLDMFSIEGANVTNVSYDNVSGNFYFEFESTNINITLIDQVILHYFPTNNSNPLYLKGQSQQFHFQFSNPNTNTSNQSSDNQTNQSSYSVFQLTLIMKYATFAILGIGTFSVFFGICMKKLAGLEAMFVLQFAWINFVWINSDFILPFTSINPLKYTFGYNYKFIPQNTSRLLSQTQNYSQFPPYTSQFNLSKMFLVNNFTFFPILLILSSVITLAIFVKCKLHTKIHPQSFVPNKSMSSTTNSAIDPNEHIDQQTQRLYKHFQLSSHILINIVMLTLICLVSLSSLYYVNKNKQQIHFQDSIIFTATLIIIFIVLVLLTRNTYQFQYLKQSFDKQKPFAQFHYILFAMFLVSVTLLLTLLPQLPWIPMIPILIMALVTLIYRPYKYLRENIRSLFNLFAMALFVGFRTYANYILNIDCKTTYILMAILILGVLSTVVIIGLVSLIYQGILEIKKQDQQNCKQQKDQKIISQETSKSMHNGIQNQTVITKYQSNDDNKSMTLSYKAQEKTFLDDEIYIKKSSKIIKQDINKTKKFTHKNANNELIFDNSSQDKSVYIQDNKQMKKTLQIQNQKDGSFTLKSKKYISAYRLKNLK